MSHQAELRRLCHLNLANAATPGFKRRELMIFEHPDRHLPLASRSEPPTTWINASQGRLTPTQRPLDCAIDGNGFFQVRRGEDHLLTRCGRFILDDAGRLSLPRSHDEPCPIEPFITLPAHFERLQVQCTGEIHTTVDGKVQLIGTISLVHVRDPSALEPAGDNLLRATAASGPVLPLPVDDRGSIIQHSIEESNVDPLEERRKLETLAVQSAPL
jgi:flagellar basal body rod protein FlgG